MRLTKFEEGLTTVDTDKLHRKNHSAFHLLVYDVLSSFIGPITLHVYRQDKIPFSIRDNNTDNIFDGFLFIYLLILLRRIPSVL